MAARLEHQPGADPVKLRQEMRPAFQHRRALKARPSTADYPHGIAASVTVDALEGVVRHVPVAFYVLTQPL